MFMINKEGDSHYFSQREITTIPLDNRASSQATREVLAREYYDPKTVVAENRDILAALSDTPFRVIAQQLVKGDPLSFDHAFLGMTHVIAATHKAVFAELKQDLEKARGKSVN